MKQLGGLNVLADEQIENDAAQTMPLVWLKADKATAH